MEITLTSYTDQEQTVIDTEHHVIIHDASEGLILVSEDTCLSIFARGNGFNGFCWTGEFNPLEILPENAVSFSINPAGIKEEENPNKIRPDARTVVDRVRDCVERLDEYAGVANAIVRTLGIPSEWTMEDLKLALERARRASSLGWSEVGNEVFFNDEWTDNAATVAEYVYAETLTATDVLAEALTTIIEESTE